jgi:hypothetical protein
MNKPNTRVVWVVYSEGSGAVQALYFRDPKTVKQGYGIIKTVLDERAIQKPHHLRVVGEKVVSVLALGGI